MRKIFSSLDIGSNSIKLVVGEFTLNKLSILCAVNVPSAGFKDNYIYDKELLKNSINDAINKVEEELSIRIKKVILNVPTSNLNFVLTDGVIDIESGVVTSNDIVKLLQLISKNKVSNQDEIICSLPISFKVDNEEVNKPFGIKCKKLGVKSILVSTDKKMIYDLANILNNLNVDIIDLTTTGLVDYYNFKNRDLDSKNVAVVNLGYTSVNISVFSKGIFINNKTIDNGSFYIQKDIAKEFNLRKNETEFLLEKIALSSLINVNKDEVININDKSNNEINISQLDITEIVSDKMEKLAKLIKKEINLLTKKEISYIIITGGLSELKDINLLINSEFNKTGRIGKINNLGARNNIYSVSLGMLKYFNDKLMIRNKEFTSLSEDEIYQMCLVDTSDNNGSSFMSRVVGYFFDN